MRKLRTEKFVACPKLHTTQDSNSGPLAPEPTLLIPFLLSTSILSGLRGQSGPGRLGWPRASLVLGDLGRFLNLSVLLDKMQITFALFLLTPPSPALISGVLEGSDPSVTGFWRWGYKDDQGQGDKTPVRRSENGRFREQRARHFLAPYTYLICIIAL